MSQKMIALRETFGSTLLELIEADPRVVVLDGDLANSTKADVVALKRREHFFQMGVAEQNMIGVAAGMASVGLVPWASSFACFLAKRDLDQIRVVVAQPKLNVKLGAAYSGILTGLTGKTHQAVEDLAVMRAMPNMVTIVPADAVEARQAMIAATRHEGPVYLRLTRDPSPVIFGDDYQFEIGRAVVLQEGRDVAIISTGVQSTRALEACQLLAAEGVSVYLLHVPTLKPLDVEAIAEAAQRTQAVVTTEDHSIIGGLGGAVAEALTETCPTWMARVGLQDVYPESAPNEALLEKYGLTPRHVAQAAKDLLARRRGAKLPMKPIA